MNLNISGINKAFVLKALYDYAKPQGMGFLDPDCKNQLALEDAVDVINEKMSFEGELCFDYYNGRVIKADITYDSFDPYLYDRDNGEGTAEEAVRHAENMADEWSKLI